MNEDYNNRGPLIGADRSHWNDPFSDWFGDFQIHKATEGKNFVDSDYLRWCEVRRSNESSLNGAYHFLNTTSGFKVEAEHFIDTCKEGGLDVIPILDLEAGALEDAIRGYHYPLQWLEEFKVQTGVTPVLYTNTYGTRHLPKEYAEYPVWIASYNKKTPTMEHWFKDKIWTLWQFTSDPFDINLFNGTAEDWRKMVWKVNE